MEGPAATEEAAGFVRGSLRAGGGRLCGAGGEAPAPRGGAAARDVRRGRVRLRAQRGDGVVLAAVRGEAAGADDGLCS